MPKCYLAGPFFTDPQRVLIRELEAALGKTLTVFSPSRDSKVGVLKKDASEQDRLQVLQENFDSIEECDVVVAVYDFLLPDDQELHVTESVKAGPGDVCNIAVYSPPLYLPDQGTVWEMGVAYTLHKPIILYCENPKANVNVMLAESAIAVVTNVFELNSVMETLAPVLGAPAEDYGKAVLEIKSRFKYRGDTH